MPGWALRGGSTATSTPSAFTVPPIEEDVRSSRSQQVPPASSTPAIYSNSLPVVASHRSVSSSSLVASQRVFSTAVVAFGQPDPSPKVESLLCISSDEAVRALRDLDDDQAEALAAASAGSRATASSGNGGTSQAMQSLIAAAPMENGMVSTLWMR